MCSAFFVSLIVFTQQASNMYQLIFRHKKVTNEIPISSFLYTSKIYFGTYEIKKLTTKQFYPQISRFEIVQKVKI